MRDIAELLEIPPSDVLDTISFYTHFWTKQRGRKTIVACRSLSCHLMGADEVIAAIKDGYLAAVDWIERHPQATLWCSFGAICALAYMAVRY